MNGGWKMLAVICALLCGYSDASMVTYFDRGSFLNQLSTSTTFSFETSDGFAAYPTAISSIGNGAVVPTSTAGPASLGIYAPVVWNQVLTGRIESFGVAQVDFLVPVQLAFAPAVYAIGFDALAQATSGPAESVVVVNFTDGAPSQQLLHQPPAGNYDEGFIGMVSTDPIAGIELYAAVPGSENVVGQCASALDNLTIGTPVPEPVVAGGVVAAMASLARCPMRPGKPRPIMGHVAAG